MSLILWGVKLLDLVTNYVNSGYISSSLLAAQGGNRPHPDRGFMKMYLNNLRSKIVENVA